MSIIQTTIGGVHTVIAIAAMVSGGFVVFRPKGTFNHKCLGYIYVLAMVSMNVTAFFTHVLYKFGPFHGLAVFSLLTIVGGVAMPIFFRANRNWLKWHYKAMTWSYVGLWAAFFSEVIVRSSIVELGDTFWAAVVSATLFVAGIGGYYIITKERDFLQRFSRWTTGT